MNDKIKCLLVKPYELPKEIIIDNTLEAKQKIVGGDIECAYLQNDNDVVLICNREGKIKGMDLNRDIRHDIIAGPFLIVGDDYENGDFKSLTNKQIEKYKVLFDENSITKTENKVNKIISNTINEIIEYQKKSYREER